MDSIMANGAKGAASRRLWFAVLAVIILGGLVSGASQAAPLINVDIDGYRLSSTPPDPVGGSPYTGIGPAGGGTWNQLAIDNAAPNTVPGGAIVDSASNVTAVTVALASWSSADWLSGTGGYAGNNLLKDYVYDSSGTATMTIGGLDPSQDYNLYLFANQGYNGATFSVNGSATKATPNGVSGVAPFVEGTHYVVFRGVYPDGSSQLVVTVSGSGTRVFNGFQLEEVPPAGTVVSIR